MTTEVTERVMTEREAHDITERIRITARNYVEFRDRLIESVREAKEGQAHVALGYKSWQAYLAEVLGEEPLRLARGERREVVQMLTEEGMSQRAIAPIVGTSRKAVRLDLQEDQLGPKGPVAPANTSQGLDGRTRTIPPKPAAPSAPTPEQEAPRDMTSPRTASAGPILSAADHRDIHQARAGGTPVREMAEQYDVSTSTIHNVLNGKSKPRLEHDTERKMEGMTNSLWGLRHALRTIVGVDDDLDPDQVAAWIKEVQSTVTELNRIKKLLKGTS